MLLANASLECGGLAPLWSIRRAPRASKAAPDRRTPRRVTTLLSLVCLLMGFGGSAVAQQRTGSLRGQVSDELGALVVGATVTLTAADGTQKTAVTNAEGTYTFNSLAPGQYTIRVASPGFTAYEKTEVAVAAGP